MLELVYVTTIYGEKIRVNKRDLEDARKALIPVYNRNGIRIVDSRSYNPKSDLGKTMLHKDNIKE
jgi:hypothetical protein